MTHDNELLPCPFCQAGETRIDERHHAPTMSGTIKEPISVTVRHWCPKKEGQPSDLNFSFIGRDRASAIEAWNTRKPPPPSGDAVRLADDEFPDEVWIATDQRWYSSERHESLPSYKYIRADLIKPEPVAGLEVLKREVFESVKDGLISGNTIEGLGDVGIVLDHLARAGHLRPAVPREVIDALDRLHVNADYNGCLRDFRTVAAALDPYMEKRE